MLTAGTDRVVGRARGTRGRSSALGSRWGVDVYRRRGPCRRSALVASLDRARRRFRVRGAHLSVDTRPHGFGVRGGRHPDRRGRVGSRCDRLFGRQLGARSRRPSAPSQAIDRQAGRGRPDRDRVGDGPRRHPGIGGHRDLAPTGEGVGLAFLAAVAISNLPESISATIGLRRSGWATRKVIGLWAGVAVASA